MQNVENHLLKILNQEEINALYSRPVFNEEKREQYFTVSPEEAHLINQFAIRSRIYCILELGYFKAQHKFFAYTWNAVSADLFYIQQRYYPNYQLTSDAVALNTRTKYQQLILRLCKFTLFDVEKRAKVETHTAYLAKLSTNPVYLFRELVQYFDSNQIVLPAYTTLQNFIGKVLEQEKQRLITFVGEKLTASEKQKLQTLLTKPDGLYEVTRLKRSPKDFGFHEMQREIARGEQLREIHDLAKRLLPLLKISNEGIKYYASLVTYYSAFRLQQLDERLAYVYLLCFAHYRYQRFQDNLITYFIYQVHHYVDDARHDAQQKLAEYQLARNRTWQQVAKVLGLFTDETIPAETPFGKVQSQAFQLLTRDQIDQLVAEIENNTQLDEVELQWAFLEHKSLEFKRRLRRVIRTVPFTTTSADEPLMLALTFLKRAFQEQIALWHYSPTEIPVGFVPDNMQHYLYTMDDDGQKQLQHDRYEFLFYRMLRNRLQAGDIFCRASYKFRSLEDDLLSDEQWKQKDALITKSGLPLVKLPIQQHLADLKEQLETLLDRVNNRIIKQQNEFVSVKKRGKPPHWSLTKPSEEVPVNHPFFDTLPLLDIHTIMWFVDKQTGFLDAFSHILHRYGSRIADKRTLVAALVAWGTNLGITRMGAISDVGVAALSRTSSNFIHLETLKVANDMVVNAMAQLPIFPLYNIDDEIYSSSDGQKFETRLHTINARYSPKYFGLQKGIVAYTLVANHVPLHAQIIGANEHESHFVFDILYNNTTEVQPTTHSTDTHGTNEVNFALLHLFGYQFAPRYKDFPDKVLSSLYGFRHPSQYDDKWLLKPIRKIQEGLIVDEWDNFQRIILSLALKTTTQSVIVGKLSSYARSNRTKRALWEYDNIICSLYLLNYVDSLNLRTNVHRALNRGESYHTLKRAISYANFGKLRFRSEHDQQIWNACAQLLTNCVIYYNSLLLSQFMLIQQNQTRNLEQRLSKVSPVAWRHINFYGRYNFGRQVDIPDLNMLVARLKIKPLA